MAKPIGTDFKISIDGEDFSAVAVELPRADAPTYLGLDLGAGPDLQIECEFRPNWPNIWHLMAITARPL